MYQCEKVIKLRDTLDTHCNFEFLASPLYNLLIVKMITYLILFKEKHFTFSFDCEHYLRSPRNSNFIFFSVFQLICLVTLFVYSWNIDKYLDKVT